MLHPCDGAPIRRGATLLLLLIWLGMLSGCATRQVSESLHGSTSQRLVTYSLERFVEELVDQPEFQRVGGNHVQLDIHFLNDHNLLDYASELLRHRLLTKSRILRVSDSGEESAQYRVQVFFNSIATDHDSFGLTLPTFGLAATPNARINVLAVDMFHGVTEGYAVITSTADATAESTQRILVRVRADNVATPIVDFPVNQLER